VDRSNCVPKVAATTASEANTGALPRKIQNRDARDLIRVRG
jgi:hypothetical protein